MDPGSAWKRPRLARTPRTEELPAARRLWCLALAALFVFALWTRVDVVAQVEHPGHGDAAFYYTAAKNLAERGRLEVDYVWHFLDPPEGLTHPAGDYWATFASVLMAAPIAAGAGLKGATALAALFGVLTGLATLFAARALGASRTVQFAACAFALLHPALLNASTSPDATIFYVAFVTATFALIARGARRPSAYAWAALTAALGYATRQDAALLAPTLLLAILLSPHDWPARRRALLRSAVVYLACVTPLLVQRYVELGSPFPPSLSRAVFARRYEDLYSYAAPLDWASYRAWGWDAILESKRAAVTYNLQTMLRALGPALAAALGIGWLRSLRRDAGVRSALLALLAFLALQIAFYGLVATVVASHGSFQRVTLALLPFLALVGLNGLDRWLPWTVVNAALLLGLCLPRVGGSDVLAQQKLRLNGGLAARCESLHVALEDTLRPGDPPPVLMTRNPWELHLTRGYGAVQIPTDGLPTVLRVAERYGVTHLVLPAPRSGVSVVAAERHPRLECVVALPDTPIRIYRLLAATEP